MKSFINFLSIYLIYIRIIVGGTSSNDEIFKLLPPIFHMDNYDECQKNGNLFCNVEILLQPRTEGNSDTKIWNFIEDLKSNKHYYDHDELYHSICLNDTKNTENFNQDEIHTKIEKMYNNKYSHLNLWTKINKIYCHNKNDEIYNVRMYDICALFFTVGYLTYIAYATFYDYESRKKKTALTDLERNWILPFSIISNWEFLNKENKSSEFEKLKCMHGFRFYTTVMIVFCHTLYSYMTAFVANTEYFEQIDDNNFRLFLRNSLVFLVQIFFLFSSFLLSYNTFRLMDENPKFQLKSIVLLLINRYFRLIALVFVMVSLDSTVWSLKLFNGPLGNIYAHQEYQRCQEKWWANLFFISNLLGCHDTCYPVMWYLSADTQLYVVSLIILSIIWINQRKNAKRILISSILFAICMQCFIIYYHNLPAIFNLTPENCKNNNFDCHEFTKLYTSTISNMATYMVGLGFGYFYFLYKNDNLLQDKIIKVLWKPLFLGLPILAIFLTLHNLYYSRLTSALLGGLLKPLFAAGIAIGVFGMTQKPGGMLPTFFENKWVLFMGSFTYSTYLSHFGPIFSRTALVTSPLFVSDSILIRSFLVDYIKAFPLGLIMHLLVELPANKLQNIYIPKVKRKVT